MYGFKSREDFTKKALVNSNYELVHFSPDVFADGEEYGVVFVEGIATEDFFDDED